MLFGSQAWASLSFVPPGWGANSSQNCRPCSFCSINYGATLKLVSSTGSAVIIHLSMLCRRGGGRAWGGDLIVFVGPGVGHLTDLVLPREGIFESFFARRGEFSSADSDEKDWDRTYVSLFPTSTLHAAPTVWIDLEITKANENKRKLGGFNCFVFKFRLF